MQSVRFILPDASVKPFVRDYAFFTHTIDGWTKEYIFSLPALREHTLQIFLDDIPTLFHKIPEKSFHVGRCNIFGLVDHSFLDSHMPAHCTRLQITFTPAGLFCLTGIPVSSFVNSLIDASLVWGRSAGILVEQLAEEQHLVQKGKIIDRFLLTVLNRKIQKSSLPEIDEIAQSMLLYSPQQDVKELAGICHKSKRQFERLFKERIGVSAKKFNCINRFVYANQLKHRSPEQSWSSIAMDCGYYDLNHLAKDFKVFGRSNITGFTGYDYTGEKVVPKQA